MWELFVAEGCIPFSVALVLMLCIAAIELITSGTASAFLDSLIPDFDGVDGLDAADGLDAVDGLDAADGMDAADVDVQVPLLTRLLGWIRAKNVPILIAFVCFLTIFSLSGYILQSVIKKIITVYLPWYIAVWPALVISIPVVRMFTGILAKFVIKGETDAVSLDSLVTRIGYITVGTAKVGQPAEAKVEDQHGKTHYVRVEPKKEEDVFPKKTKIVLVRKDGNVFKAIPYGDDE